MLHSTQALEFMQSFTKKKMTTHDARHLLRENRSSMINQMNSVTQAEYNECPARFAHHLIRRAHTGVGWKNNAVAKQTLPLASNWTSRGFDVYHLQFFTWNAGNLQRSVRNDTIDDLLAQG